VTSFVLACAAMIAAAVLWIVVPLLRRGGAVDDASSRKERHISGIVVAIAVPVLAAVMYAGLSNWDWNASEEAAAQSAGIEEMLHKLEAKLAQNPRDINGWLLLGRSYTALQRFPRAVDAYQQAYDLSQGQNVDAIVGLAEALALTDEASLSGRAGQLFDAALEKAPNHPKALWYGSVAALQAGDLRRGRDRLRLLLAQNPPAELRGVLERQIQDLDQQLNEPGQGAAQASSAPGNTAEGSVASAGRTIRVSVSIAPELKKQLTAPLSLFILARDPAAGGPPLAVQRRSSTDLPLTVDLTERDAMIATRTIASVPRVQVVARLSKSGGPQARSGDLYGEADYEFAAQGAENTNKSSGGGGTLNIIIDRAVP
jgi:cytochrome c-type biogenesis protein CcmH